MLNCLFINVNLPCSGTVNRLTTCVDLLADIWSWREYYSDCKCVIGGDFNTNLDSCDEVARYLTDFINDCLLVRCDDFPNSTVIQDPYGLLVGVLYGKDLGLNLVCTR